MSDAPGNPAGTTAPPPAPNPQPSDVKPAAPPPPFSRTPQMTEGITPAEALKELSARRKRAAAPQVAADGRQIGATAAGQMAAAPLGTAAGSEPAPDAAPGEAKPADPIDKLIEAFRRGDGKPEPDGAVTDSANGAAATVDGLTLTIDGNAQNFTREQLINHVRMSADYTKKTSELAALTRQVNERAQALDQLLPVIIPEIQRQISALDTQLGTQIDWQRLATENPAEYQRQDAMWKAAQMERQRLSELAQLQARETEAQQRVRLQQGHQELISKLPGWEDPQTRGRYQQEMIKWGRANGFQDTELSQVYEARHIVTLWKAMAFDRMMNGVRTDAPVVPQVRQRGQPPPPQAAAAQTDFEAQFSANPSVRNAQALLSARRRQQN